jgi:hypothetical protein
LLVPAFFFIRAFCSRYTGKEGLNMPTGDQQGGIKIRTGGTQSGGGSPKKSSDFLQYALLGLTGVCLVLLGVWVMKDSLEKDQALDENISDQASMIPVATPDAALVLGERAVTPQNVIVSADLSDSELRGLVIDRGRIFSVRKSALLILAERNVHDLAAIVYAGILNADSQMRIYFLNAVVDLLERDKVDLDSKNALAVLVPSLGDTDSMVRSCAAKAIGRVHDSLALNALYEQLGKEASPNVKYDLEEAIERINGYYLNSDSVSRGGISG